MTHCCCLAVQPSVFQKFVGAKPTSKFEFRKYLQNYSTVVTKGIEIGLSSQFFLPDPAHIRTVCPDRIRTCC